MMKKKYNKKQQGETKVEEMAVDYQRNVSSEGITRVVTQAELEEVCYTLEESKAIIIEKIHRHFHSNEGLY